MADSDTSSSASSDSSSLSETPIIIKRIKKGGHGHHGGAWKVAYADFVTAMMAFFLLLWLLNTTTPEQKLGLAEYFTPTIGIKDSKGVGFRGGKKPTEEGTSRTDLTKPGLVIGQAQQGPIAADPTNVLSKKVDPDAPSTSSPKKSEKPSDESQEDAQEFQEETQDIKQSLEQDPDLKDYQNDVVVQDTPEGLKIDMIDDEKKPMFIPGGAGLTDMGKRVLDSMSRIVSKSPNNIAINGHTDVGSATQNPQYSNWELSTDRANAARRFLSTTQLEPERVQKVVGMADRELLSPQEPTSPRNRRITIVVLRGSYFRDPKSMPTTKSLLSVPDAKVKTEEKKQETPQGEDNDSTHQQDSIFNPNNVIR